MNLYFDIDGVLLTKNKQVPKGASELLSFAAKNFKCYWLTTHCRMGVNRAIEYLGQYYPDSDLPNLSRILPTNWSESKTEGIDWNANFIWLDDFAFEFEKAELREKNLLDSLVLVKLEQQNELRRIVERIKETASN